MHSLELKVPPPVIAILCVALAWVLASAMPGFTYPLPFRTPIAVAFGIAGVFLAVSGVFAFRRARTTVNPHTPEKSTSIVRTGAYGFTRNPMYLGFAIVILGICAYLANPFAILAVVVFVSYITRFQIMPEERLLLDSFGESYAQYKKSVRRWI